MHATAGNGHTEILGLLLERGADIEEVSLWASSDFV